MPAVQASLNALKHIPQMDSLDRFGDRALRLYLFPKLIILKQLLFESRLVSFRQSAVEIFIYPVLNILVHFHLHFVYKFLNLPIIVLSFRMHLNFCDLTESALL